MYFLVYEVFPRPSHPEYGRIDGAYATLFVNQLVLKAAESAAQTLIEGEGWEIEKLEEAHPILTDSYPPGHPSQALVAQARADGIVATFHRWPVGAPDEE